MRPARSKEGELFGYANSTHCLTFSNKSLLRGVDGTNVLSGLGAIFSESGGTEETYGLSRRVERLDAFISHNWAMARPPKVLSLLFFYNIVPASIAGLVGACVGFVLTVAKVLPVYEVYLEAGPYLRGPWSLVIGFFSFSVTFASWHKVLHCLGQSGWVLFLDKACIHQTDLEQKEKGIASLGAFMNMSEKMVIVYSEHYLQRLWTVYELASFLALKSSSDMVVLVPEFVTLFLLLIWLPNVSLVVNFWLHRTEVLSTIGREGEVLPALQRMLINLVWMASILPAVYLIRRWSRTLQSIRIHMEGFSVRRAACFMESDRELIYSNITGFMLDMGLVKADAHRDMALDAFDEMVRRTVPRAVMGTLQRMMGASYRVALGLSLNWAMVGMDRCAGAIVEGRPEREVALLGAYFVTLALAMNPIVYVMLYCLASMWQELRGFGELLLISGVSLFSWLAWTCVVLGLLVVRDYAFYRDEYVPLFFMYIVLVFCACYVVFKVQGGAGTDSAAFPCAECVDRVPRKRTPRSHWCNVPSSDGSLSSCSEYWSSSEGEDASCPGGAA